jgi:hypothetical protein
MYADSFVLDNSMPELDLSTPEGLHKAIEWTDGRAKRRPSASKHKLRSKDWFRPFPDYGRNPRINYCTVPLPSLWQEQELQEQGSECDPCFDIW